MDISAFCGYYTHFMDTIHIVLTTIYLARNVCHVLQSLVVVVDIMLGHITSYLACNVHPACHILLN